jgi:hypothetical protein
MKLQRLLYELQRNILHDRSDAVAGSSDQLWDQESLVNYINEAQDEFCRRTEVIRDYTTPEVCQVQLVAGQNMYPLHPSVIGVMSVTNSTDNCDLARAGHSALQTYQTPDTYFFNPQDLSNLPPGKPLAYTTDEGMTANDEGSMEVVNLRIYPMVGAGYGTIVNLRVVRRAIQRLSLENLNAVPEIPSSYHMKMLDYAAYLALRYCDLDVAGADQTIRMRDFNATFDRTCAQVVTDLKRKIFAPAVWGFGRNGFSYQGEYNN